MTAPAEMTDAALLVELQGLFTISVGALERGAGLLAEVHRRGMTCTLKSVVMRDYLRPIGAKTLSAAAVVRYCDLPGLLRRIALLPLIVQEELAAGRLLDCVMGGEVVPVSARDCYPSFVGQVFPGAGKIATAAEQEAALAAHKRLQEARAARRVERLCRKLERDAVSTPLEAIEVMIAAGWRFRGTDL